MSFLGTEGLYQPKLRAKQLYTCKDLRKTSDYCLNLVWIYIWLVVMSEIRQLGFFLKQFNTISMAIKVCITLSRYVPKKFLVCSSYNCTIEKQSPIYRISFCFILFLAYLLVPGTSTIYYMLFDAHCCIRYLSQNNFLLVVFEISKQ